MDGVSLLLVLVNLMVWMGVMALFRASGHRGSQLQHKWNPQEEDRLHGDSWRKP